MSDQERAVAVAGALALVAVLQLPPGRLAAASNRASKMNRKRFHKEPGCR